MAQQSALDQDWLVRLLIEFSEPQQISAVLMPLCRRSFSIASCHPFVFHTPIADRLASIFSILDREDKRLQEEAERIERMAHDASNLSHAIRDEGRVVPIANVNEVLEAMWRAVDAATTHADTCAYASKMMLKHAGTISSCLRWLKTVGVPDSCSNTSTLGGTVEEIRRRELINHEVAEFHQRIALLCWAAESLSSAMSIRGGLVARNERLSHAARTAKLVGVPEAELEEFQQRCTGIHEIWGDNSKKFHAIEVSMHMRALVFLDLTQLSDQTSGESSTSLGKARLSQTDVTAVGGIQLMASPQRTRRQPGSVAAQFQLTPVSPGPANRSSTTSRSSADCSTSNAADNDACSAGPERDSSLSLEASDSPTSTPQRSVTGVPWRFTVSLLECIPPTTPS